MRPGAMGASPQIPQVGHGTGRSGSHSFKLPSKPEFLEKAIIQTLTGPGILPGKVFTKTEKLLFLHNKHFRSTARPLLGCREVCRPRLLTAPASQRAFKMQQLTDCQGCTSQHLTPGQNRNPAPETLSFCNT